MNATATDTHEQHDSHAHGLSDATAIKIALILGAMTALEVSTYFVDFGAFFMPVLMVLMVVKFLTVVSYFMHLKFDEKIYRFMVILVLAIYAVVIIITFFDYLYR